MYIIHSEEKSKKEFVWEHFANSSGTNRPHLSGTQNFCESILSHLQKSYGHCYTVQFTFSFLYLSRHFCLNLLEST